MDTWSQPELPFGEEKPRYGHGGWRPNAGRPRSTKRSRIPHRKRPSHWKSAPVHMTMRAVDGLPSFRQEVPFKRVARALAKASTESFRVVHFSVQSNHVHLIVEADGNAELRSGAQGLAIRVARALNKAFRRTGKVWSARHERHDLRTPSEVRNALVYVLFNFRKHVRGAVGVEWARRSLDPKSSALWFDGWSPRAGPAFARLEMEAKAWLARGPVVVRPPEVWLLTTGWRRHGLLQASESPRQSLGA